jgi:Amt family ammonium transporter
MNNSQFLLLNAQFAMLALLLPAGFILLAAGELAGRRPAKAAVAGLGGLALAAISYWACGFAFHMGGVGLVSDPTVIGAGLEGLVWEWASPLNLEWGVMGLRGFLLLEEAATLAALTLYLAYLPSLAVAVILPLLSVRGRLPGWMAALGGLLVAALVYPMAANWFSGGGWLMHIGHTLDLGHGYVDLTGLSTAAFVGGLAALLGIIIFGRRLPPLPDGELPILPPVHLPVLAIVGAILIVVGGMGLSTANPLHTQAGVITPRVAVNLVLAAAGGAFLPCLYTWFTTGAADSLMAARGAAAGVLAVAAAMAFVPPWTALALGLVAGLLVPLVSFLLRYVLRIEDPTAAVPVGLLGGLLGVLAAGIFSDGLSGQGWNGVGQEAYLGVAGQGVTGFFPAPGLAPDWPGQVNAQLVGLAAIALLTVALVGVLFFVLKVLLLLWRAVPPPEEAHPPSSSEQESETAPPEEAHPPGSSEQESETAPPDVSGLPDADSEQPNPPPGLDG